ncbi:autotransporter outer membrane beta-barrel domain-containing protein [Paenalcaligenes sp. Me131]|uniref:autotransporter family protein n=1 Tax=Paenalcaligenes sp. Me131 TaxID=3392636 RepID=UPI003D270047
MRFVLNPIMVSLLGGVVLTAASASAMAEVYESINLTLGAAGGPASIGADDQVIFKGTNTGGAVTLGAGQTFTANGSRISAEGERVYGIGSSASNATVDLTNTTVNVTQTNGVASQGAINLTGSNSQLRMKDTDVVSHDAKAPAMRIGNGGKADIQGGTVYGEGNSLVTVDTNAQLVVTGSTFTHNPSQSKNALNLGRDSSLALTDVTFTTAGGFGGVGSGSTVTIDNSVLRSYSGGLWGATGASVAISDSDIYIGDESIKGSNTSGPGSMGIQVGGSTMSLTNSTVQLDGANGGQIFKVDRAGDDLTLKKVNVKDVGAAKGKTAIGVWVVDNATVRLEDVTLDVGRAGIDMRQGEIVAERLNITTAKNGVAAHGVYVEGNPAWAGTPGVDQAAFHGKDITIHTQAGGAVGVYVLTRGGAVLDVAANTENVNILTEGASSHGVYMVDGFDIGTPKLDMKGTTNIVTQGNGAVGVYLRDDPLFTFETLNIRTEGENADGIRLSNATNTGANWARTMDGVSIQSAKASALRATNVGVDLTITDSDIRGRQLFTLDGAETSLTSSSLTSKNSTLVGNVQLRDGAAISSFVLDDKSRWVGGVDNDDASSVGTIALQNNSTWLMTRSSEVDKVVNKDGYLLFQPDLTENFKTLRVNEYEGGGHLAMSVYLEGDGSGSDRLLIGDNGSVTGTTELHILNVRGPGGKTTQGIPLVLGGAGAIIPEDAFTLSAQSSGYRPSTETISANGFEYSLVGEDKDGTNKHQWYLRSAVNVPPDPGPGPGPGPGTDPEPEDDHENLSPEGPAYLAAHRASLSLFTHSFHEREINQQGLAAGERKVWGRAVVRTDKKMGFKHYDEVDAKVTSSMFQFGGDVWGKHFETSELRTGLMAGMGHIEAKSTSEFINPGDISKRATLRAKDKRTGYNVGAYATYQDNAVTREGWFVDGVLQFTHYRGKLSGELGTMRHNNELWQVVAEAGYGLKYAPESTLLITPKAQLIYSRLSGDDGEVQGTNYGAQHKNTVQSRLGVRFEAVPGSLDLAVRPFMELAWIHRFRDPAIAVGDNRFQAKDARNAGEIQVGLDAELSNSTMMSARFIREQGSGATYGMSGMVNLNYKW